MMANKILRVRVYKILYQGYRNLPYHVLLAVILTTTGLDFFILNVIYNKAENLQNISSRLTENFPSK